jgi:hypothetical protein
LSRAASVLLFRATKAPNLINFDLFTGQPAHFLIHNALASLANSESQTANGFFWTPVMRSMAPMLEPSQSMEITATFFSVGSMCAITFLTCN